MTLVIWMACIVLAPFALMVLWIALSFTCAGIWCAMLAAHDAICGSPRRYGR
jgi:hypothetical protein